MSSDFFSLPRELRDRIYELVLLHQELIDPWVDYDRRQKLTPELLQVNRAIHREASLLLYAQNYFGFTMGTSEDVASFLRQIGRNNADHIRHICVGFPCSCSNVERNTRVNYSEVIVIRLPLCQRCDPKANSLLYSTRSRPTRAFLKKIQAKEQSKDSSSLMRQSNLPRPSAPLGPFMALSAKDLAQSCTYLPKISLTSNQNGAPGKNTVGCIR